MNKESGMRHLANGDYSKMAIETLDLSVKTYNCLKRAGINTVEDFIHKTPDEMLRIRNLDQPALDELIEAMNTKGLHLKAADANTLESIEAKADILKMPIEKLELSIKTFNSLKRAGINTVSDISSKTEDEIMKIQHLEQEGLEEITVKMKGLDLKLKNE